MKKIKIQSLLAAALILGSAPVMLTSCDDTLDMPSYTADDIEFVFSDVSKAEIFVKGCYRGLVHEEQFRMYNTGDGVTAAAEDAYSGSKFFISNFYYNPTQGPYTLSTSFSENYRIIEACNVGLKNLAALGESKKRDQLMAELYTIRAFCYHNLIRMYGDVPAKWDPDLDKDITDSSVLYPSRTSRDEIYDHIIKDITDHVDALPWFSEADYATPERFTKQGALGILARICLHAGGYSLRWDLKTFSPASLQMARRDDQARVDELYKIADDALKRIIFERNENDLVQAGNGMSGYQNLFYNYCQRNFGVTSTEFLFQTANLGTSTNSNFGVCVGQPGSTGGVYGQRKTLQFKLPTYYLSFDPADTRRDVACTNYTVTYLDKMDGGTYTNIGTGYSSVQSGKFRIQWCTAPAEAAKRNVDIPILRFADVLLMFAETQNYINHGPTGDAIAALQRVRDRAGVGHLPIPEGQDEFQKAIMQERQWELSDEMTLRTDLIRMDLLDYQVHKTQDELIALSDHAGKYADVPRVRLYPITLDAQEYGNKFLTMNYIEITDANELAQIQAAEPFYTPAEGETLTPRQLNQKNYEARQAHLGVVKTILGNHGIANSDTDTKWYATRMFEAWNSAYNKGSRQAAGYSADAISVIGVGSSMYTQATGREENNSDPGTYPRWINGDDRTYYSYQRNKVELLPFANISVGHPLVDNPNLKQHPGYN
ncbi:MAG: RagB/SusD family nutrient uptake outer membrane protein [[Clostridium] fimetarium]|nr:RagB/SusD family nutrient uptake outer membrane protein [Alistipes timonensis]MCM1406296.1 RagB/SusD family nutrient uptake outer membrane protein [[Clostridium] fimetarium]